MGVLLTSLRRLVSESSEQYFLIKNLIFVQTAMKNIIETNKIALQKKKETFSQLKRHVNYDDALFTSLIKDFPYHGIVNFTYENVPLYMFSANDDLCAMTQFWFGPYSYETVTMGLFFDLLKFCESVYDLGAYTGPYSLLASKASFNIKTIVSVEANPEIFSRLRENLKINGLNNQNDRIQSFCRAISNSDSGTIKIHYNADARFLDCGGTTLDLEDVPWKQNKKDYYVVNPLLIKDLPNIHSDGLAIFKVDVEGLEIETLSQIFVEKQKQPLIVFVELLEKKDIEEAVNLVEEYNSSIMYINETTSKLMEINDRFSREKGSRNFLIFNTSAQDYFNHVLSEKNT